MKLLVPWNIALLVLDRLAVLLTVAASRGAG
jgi:hypothetical protein